jgi:hypothetical protein
MFSSLSNLSLDQTPQEITKIWSKVVRSINGGKRERAERGLLVVEDE